MSGAPEPFAIAVPDAVLDDLRTRLRRARWPDQVAAPWAEGTDAGYLRELVDHWAERFDWRAQEQRLNALAQFRAEVDGLGIHFVHERATAPSGVPAMPLLLLHGWPSTFLQMRDVVPLLSDEFDVVVPSLPGYGFSDRPQELGTSVTRIAELLLTLMRDTLGYKRFGIRASDVGAGVAARIAMLAPEAVVGLHMNAANPFIDESHLPHDLTDAEQRMLDAARAFRATESAYATLHATKPQTAAYGLTDSPVGLAAWIVEKLRAWSDCEGQLEHALSRDDVLSTLTIYWATETADLFPTPRSWVERQMPVARWTELSRGGHFTEWEVPEAIAADLIAFFGDLS